MKKFIPFTTAVFLLVQCIGHSQNKNTNTMSKTQDTVLQTQDAKTEVDTKKFKDFIGKYILVEADFELEIIEEDNMMYIVSPFSIDKLIQINETTLREPTRGVDLERIQNNENALKFTQNGYVTTLKRVDAIPEK